jgi:hypothetical protein
MSNADSLTPGEIRTMWWRGLAARLALVVTFAIDATLLITVGHEEVLPWVVVILGGLLCFVLFERYRRCPRCGVSVWGKSADSDDGPGHAVFGRLVPDRCRSCHVGLTVAPTAAEQEIQ